jgi:hypothetical protein
MASRKLLKSSSTREQSEISLVYQSVTESALGADLGTSLQRQISQKNRNENASSRKGSKTLRLGGNSREGKITRGRVKLHCLLKLPAHLIIKLKEQYASWKEGARRANIRVSDLFVANQVFMHVQATPAPNTRRKQAGLKPSVGFVNRVEVHSGGQREMRER